MLWTDMLAIALVLTIVAGGILAWLTGARNAVEELDAFFGLTPAKAETANVYRVTLGPPRPIKLSQRPPQPRRPRMRRGLPLVIQRTPHPLWREKGWRKIAGRDEYQGEYRADGRSYRGRITQPYPGHFEVYIWNPPLDQLKRNTSHSSCFTDRQSDGRYKVHFSLEPVSLDHAITSIEVVLAEALTGRKL